jgi:hypothetical protein
MRMASGGIGKKLGSVKAVRISPGMPGGTRWSLAHSSRESRRPLKELSAKAAQAHIFGFDLLRSEG